MLKKLLLIKVIHLSIIAWMLVTGCQTHHGEGNPASTESWQGNWLAVAEHQLPNTPKEILNPRDALMVTVGQTHLQIHDLKAIKTELTGVKWPYEFDPASDSVLVNTDDAFVRIGRNPDQPDELWLIELKVRSTLQIAGLKFRPLRAEDARTYYDHFFESQQQRQRILADPSHPDRHTRDTAHSLKELNGYWQMVGVRSDAINISNDMLFNDGHHPQVLLIISDNRLVKLVLTATGVVSEEWPLTFDRGSLWIRKADGKQSIPVRWLSQSGRFMYLDAFVLAESGFQERFERVSDIPQEFVTLL